VVLNNSDMSFFQLLEMKKLNQLLESVELNIL